MVKNFCLKALPAYLMKFVCICVCITTRGLDVTYTESI